MSTTQNAVKSSVGLALPRVDGPLKVSGSAVYTSDHNFPGMLYAVPVCSIIASGRIEKLETGTAEKMPGVRAIYRRENIGKLFRTAADPDFSAHLDEQRPALADDVINYYGQYVALVVADTFEQAKAAADAVSVTYTVQKPNVDVNIVAEEKPSVQSERGDPEKAFAKASVTIDETYITPTETHNAIELHATLAVWDGTSFTLYETTQGVMNHQAVMLQTLGIRKENLRIVARFLGSGFGGKLFPWTHSALAAVAARLLNQPVKLVTTRQMAFQTVGHRPRTQQRIRVGATADGKLVSLQQDYVNHTSILDDYKEDCGEATPFLYSVPNLRVTAGLARRNVGAPTAMRGPGAVPGLYATESAMDELAIKLKIDPVQLRLLNEPNIDEGLNIPFSSRHLTECLTTGAAKFGWSKRNPKVGSMKRDGLTLGWGVAGCSWLAERFPAEAAVELFDDGTVRVSSATQDIGTGTYTALAQIVSEKTGVPIEKVSVVLGDSALPPGPLSGGSMGISSMIPALSEAVGKAIDALLSTTSQTPGSPFAKMKPDTLRYTNGLVHSKDEPAAKGTRYEVLLQKANIRAVSGKGRSPGTFGSKATVSMHSYGAHFLEVTWQEEIARLRVSRVITVVDAGRIINPRMARNQIEGAVVMGVGMGLFEETSYDPRNGAPINSNLADYVVATNADTPAIEVHFLDYPDLKLNELGARGVGEIGLAGVAAALTAAVYHATGVRVRELPIRIENLLPAS